ncbi:hypothetical protein K3495_g6765 [Podosphaera aphanis]|nr:hypothetical protein K3495_g6765 [Podosphaera aphanis]
MDFTFCKTAAPNPVDIPDLSNLTTTSKNRGSSRTLMSVFLCYEGIRAQHFHHIQYLPSPLSATLPTSVNEVESSAQANRTILNPAPFIKRADQIAIESYTQTRGDYSQRINASLP